MAAPLTVEATAARYRREHRFAVHVDAYDHIILRAGSVDGIQMPRTLAELVHAELEAREVPTPVILNTTTGNRTFLTHAASALDDRPVRLFGSLFRYQAIRTVAGALIMLPGPSNTDIVREWSEPPRADQRPDFELLVTITLAAAERLSTARRTPVAGVQLGAALPKRQ